jgi:hypothetical protein
VILPANEQLGEMMLEFDRPQEALQAFETSLASAPDRFNSLYGAAHAAEVGGDSAKAKLYYSKLLSVGEKSKRMEMAKAEAFLGHPPSHPKP